MLLHLRVKAEKYESFQNDCHGKSTFEELFTLLWDLEIAHDSLTPKLIPAEKSSADANRLRIRGNESYKGNHFERALEFYNLSIMSAPHPVLDVTTDPVAEGDKEDNLYLPPSVETKRYGGTDGEDSKCLAMGYANRSAVLYKLDLYERCLSDIDLAMKYGYPAVLQETLETRKRKCLNYMMFVSPVNDSSEQDTANDDNETLELKPSPDLNELLLATLQISLRREECPSLTKLFTRKVPHEFPKVEQPHPNIPALSSAVKVSHDPYKGRGLFATRDIRPGEVIGVEKAYCVSADVDRLWSYCSMCLSLCIDPLPCPACSAVVFCTERCRSIGLAGDHWIECRILPTVVALGLANRNLTYKLLKSFSYKNLSCMLKELEKDTPDKPEEAGMNKNGIYNSASYQTVYHLCTNKDGQPFEFLIVQCQLAFIMTKLLVLSERFFIDDNGEPFTPSREELITTGGVLLSHVLKIRCNLFEIRDVKMKRSVGVGLFPALSLINHSCNPSTKDYTRGRYLVLRAVRPVSAGEELTLSYTLDFAEQDKEKRRKGLQIYNFDCNCEACVGDWPVYSELPPIKLINKDKLPRREEKKRVDQIWHSVFKTCQIGVQIGAGDPVTKEDYKFMCEAIEMVYKNVEKPSQNVSNMQNVLARCFDRGL